jgi:hypothetical protein
MTQPIFDDITVGLLAESIKLADEDRVATKETADNEKDLFMKMLLLQHAMYEGEIAQSFRASLMIMRAINSIGHAIERLPDKNEFDAVKVGLEDTKLTVIDTLEPLRNAVKESREIKQLWRTLALSNRDEPRGTKDPR